MNDTISRQMAIDAADRADYTGLAIEDVKKVTDEVIKELIKLPSAEPKEIGYLECSSALLKMWIDNVVTDGEHRRISEKLEKYWAERRKDEKLY